VSRPAVLTRRARAELRDALGWIGGDNPAAARGLNDAVQEAAVRIGKNPQMGRHRPALAGSRYRFWSIVRYGYLLVYTDQVQPPRIVRIVSTARDLPRILSDLGA
jgi:plasmid stabilization system protein ParE